MRLLLLLLSISGCSSYQSKFICHDAKGLPCIMLNNVDRKISNNSIEQSISETYCCNTSRKKDRGKNVLQ